MDTKCTMTPEQLSERRRKHNEYMREYYKRNRNKFLEANKRYFQTERGRERNLLCGKRYRDKNRERYRATALASYYRHRDTILTKRKAKKGNRDAQAKVALMEQQKQT